MADGGRVYRVREVFDTLQGEGARAGTRAVFLRLAFCNLWSGIEADRDKGRGACARWCDTDFAAGEPRTADEILRALEECWPWSSMRTRGFSGRGAHKHEGERWVVITGGEPTLQVDRVLLQALRAARWHVAMETNGTRDPEEGGVLPLVHHLCVSPKLGGELVVKTAHELKIVVPGVVPGDHRFGDGWTEDRLEEVRTSGSWGECFLQPQDAPGPAQAANVAMAVATVRRMPWWRLSLQTQKLLGIP